MIRIVKVLISDYSGYCGRRAGRHLIFNVSFSLFLVKFKNDSKHSTITFFFQINITYS